MERCYGLGSTGCLIILAMALYTCTLRPFPRSWSGNVSDYESQYIPLKSIDAKYIAEELIPMCMVWVCHESFNGSRIQFHIQVVAKLYCLLVSVVSNRD